jgi:hypothetical protein
VSSSALIAASIDVTAIAGTSAVSTLLCSCVHAELESIIWVGNASTRSDMKKSAQTADVRASPMAGVISEYIRIAGSDAVPVIRQTIS